MPDHKPSLSQFFTPGWAAEALIEKFYPGLGPGDRVLEPSCGAGAFLAAIPETAEAFGVEIDPEWATIARRNSGRPVIVGDFLAADIPTTPNLIVGNPPFKQRDIQAFLQRSWELLPSDGEVGFILPAYAFQTASVTAALGDRWGVYQDLLPRNIFPRLRLPIAFARLTKGRKTGLFGFALYAEANAVNRLQRRYRALLAAGETSAWRAVTIAALEAAGGESELTDIYREIEGARPTPNVFWKEKVRQTVQRVAFRTAPGRWRLKSTPDAMAA